MSEESVACRGARTHPAAIATFIVFALNGAGFASWVSRIPDVRTALDLAPGSLGLLLLAASLGSVIGLPAAGAVAARFGASRTVLGAAVLCLVSLAATGVSVGVAGSTGLTAVALFGLGFGIGQWDVAMNLHGAQVERQARRTIMPLFHAGFSLGTVVAALVAVPLVALRVPIAAHLGVAAALLLAATAVAVRSFLPRAGPEPVSPADPRAPGGAGSSPRARPAWFEGRTLLIGLVTLVAGFTEGAANDWLSVAFVDGHGLPAWAGVLALSTFLVFMTAGRLVGTALLDRFGRTAVLRPLLVLAGVGSLLVILGTPPLAFVGAAIWGFGVSLGFPCGMSAAADDPRRAAARVSVVSTIAYAAFLIGPPFIGFLGDHVGVLRALAVVSLLLVVALVALPALHEPGAEPAAGV